MIHIKRGIDLYSQASSHQELRFSQFYNPIEMSEIENVIQKRSRDMLWCSFGGFKEAERKKLVFYPSYMTEVTEKDFPIVVLEIRYDRRFHKQLGHRDFLGSLLGLGIDRSFVGDILIFEDKAHVYMDTQMGQFAADQLYRVGNANVSAKKIDMSDVPAPLFTFIEKQVTLPSLRVDAVISEGFSMSRGKASQYVENQKVFINWKLVENKASSISKGDIITIRGIGRVEVVDFIGKSKKGRYITQIKKYG